MKSALAAFCLFLACVAPAPAKTAKVLKSASVPTADAALKAISDVIADSLKRQAQLSGRAAVLQQQVATIKAKIKNPKMDLAEQLSKEDVDTVNLLSVQLRYLENEALVEAVRQKDLGIAMSLYQASFFVATMMTEYIGSKGALDDEFDRFCRLRAKAYGLEMPVGLLLGAQDYIIENTPKK